MLCHSRCSWCSVFGEWMILFILILFISSPTNNFHNMICVPVVYCYSYGVSSSLDDQMVYLFCVRHFKPWFGSNSRPNQIHSRLSCLPLRTSKWTSLPRMWITLKTCRYFVAVVFAMLFNRRPFCSTFNIILTRFLRKCNAFISFYRVSTSCSSSSFYFNFIWNLK